MNNRFYLSAFLLLIFVTISISSKGQDDRDPEGEIEDVQVEIVKDREIILPPAVRKFDKVPPQDDVQQRPQINYTYSVPGISLSPLDLRLRPLRIKDEPLQKTYGNYVAAGFGNYVTPYFEAFLNTKRENNYTYGLHGKYLTSAKGPVDEKNSGNGMFEVDMFGSYFGKAASLSGDLGFRRRHLHFYGYPEEVEVKRDSLKQHFNHIFAEGILEGTDSRSPMTYKLKMAADYLSDNLENYEAQGGISWNSQYNFNDDGALLFNFSYDFINYSTRLTESSNRHLLRVQPRVKFNIIDISIIAGFNAAYENDTLGASDDLHFYPYAEATYQINEQWMSFARLSGDVEKQSFTEISYDNPFLGPENLIFHSNKTFDFTAGIKGRFNQKIGWQGGISLQAYKNMLFYVNDDQFPSVDFYNNLDSRPYWFSAIYDRGTTNVFSAYTELNIIASEDLYSNFKATWNSYNTGEIDEAYHRPSWLLEADVFYQLVDKINLNLNFYGIGGIKAIDQNGSDITLDPALDLNLKVDYLLSDRVSVFTRFNNIFSQNYVLLNRYPVRGFQVIGGLTYNF
jgi:hypothetical protein